MITMCLLALLAPAASAEIYRWDDAGVTVFTDDLASVPEEYREKASAAAAGQLASAAPQVEEAATGEEKPVTTRQITMMASRDAPEQHMQPRSMIRHSRNMAGVARDTADGFPSLAAAVVTGLLSMLFLTITWVITIFQIGTSRFITPEIKTTWMLVVIFLPFIGMLFYYILGLQQRSTLTAGIKASY